MWTQSTSVTDRQTNKITMTDRATHIASRNKNWVRNLRPQKLASQKHHNLGQISDNFDRDLIANILQFSGTKRNIV